MDILGLKLFVTEAEVNDLAKKHFPDGAVENLRIRVTPEGVVVSGEYPALGLRVAFETLWELSASGPELQARLATVKVAGFSAGILKGALLKMARDAVGHEPGLRVQDESVAVNVEEAARARGVPVRVRFTAVRCSIASLVLEAAG